MIDFWEALGRLSYDAELNDRFVAEQGVRKTIKVLTIAGDGDKPGGSGRDIPGPDYDKVQKFWNPILRDRMLSLTSAGELIYTYSDSTARDGIVKLQMTVKKAQPALKAPSPSYFVALGSLMLDPILRQQLRKTPTSWPIVFPNVSTDERANLQGLVGIDDTSGFGYESNEFCRVVWNAGCLDRVLFWEGHLHPVAVDEYATAAKA